MTTFRAVTDETLVAQIASARRRLVFVAPGVTTGVALALETACGRDSLAVTIILDSDEDAYRVGFGDPDGLAKLHLFAKNHSVPLRRQPGLRIGLVVADDVVIIWSPTPKAVEANRRENEPNGIVLHGDVAAALDNAVGGGTSDTLPGDAEIGTKALRPEDTERMVQELRDNPPAPFDLSQKTRVFSTRFQFVEVEVQGAEWTQRKITISSLLLNADLPEDIQDILETQIRPYQTSTDTAIDVQSLVLGQLAYNSDGQPILVPTRQADLASAWKQITARYLFHLKGFGWLIRKTDLAAFRSSADGYTKVLKSWVDKFREKMQQDENRLVSEIAQLIRSRVERSTRQLQFKPLDLEKEVRKGIARMRVIEPKVRIVTKEVSWESTRDQEFTQALRSALKAEELAGWFEEFTAAKQRNVNAPPGN
jgi:hypothetical protein